MALGSRSPQGYLKSKIVASALRLRGWRWEMPHGGSVTVWPKPSVPSSASSLVRPREARAPPVVELPHDIGFYADLNWREEMLDSHEWQAQRIVGERQTPSGLEYEASVEKTLWLPRATLDTKLVRRYRAEQRAVTRIRTRWSSRLQKASSSVTQRR
jgi:hypothetical protein